MAFLVKHVLLVLLAVSPNLARRLSALNREAHRKSSLARLEAPQSATAWQRPGSQQHSVAVTSIEVLDGPQQKEICNKAVVLHSRDPPNLLETLRKIFERDVMRDFTPRAPWELPRRDWVSVDELGRRLFQHAPNEMCQLRQKSYQALSDSVKSLITDWYKDHPAFKGLSFSAWVKHMKDYSPLAAPRSVVFKVCFEHTPGGFRRGLRGGPIQPDNPDSETSKTGAMQTHNAPGDMSKTGTPVQRAWQPLPRKGATSMTHPPPEPLRHRLPSHLSHQLPHRVPQGLPHDAPRLSRRHQYHRAQIASRRLDEQQAMQERAEVVHQHSRAEKDWQQGIGSGLGHVRVAAPGVATAPGAIGSSPRRSWQHCTTDNLAMQPSKQPSVPRAAGEIPVAYALPYGHQDLSRESMSAIPVAFGVPHVHHPPNSNSMSMRRALSHNQAQPELQLPHNSNSLNLSLNEDSTDDSERDDAEYAEQVQNFRIAFKRALDHAISPPMAKLPRTTVTRQQAIDNLLSDHQSNGDVQHP